MKDEFRLCHCGQQHRYGIVGYSNDNVPLYGGRPKGACENFRELKEGEERDANLPALTQDRLNEIWSKTHFMNAQVPVATRLAYLQMQEASQGKKGIAALTKQWPEFVMLMLSQITDVRGAFVRSDSKFAHLVAHIDEIVETMRKTAQLEKQLETMTNVQNQILDRLKRLHSGRRRRRTAIDKNAAAHFGLGYPADVGGHEPEADAPRPNVHRELETISMRQHAELWNEPIVVDAVES